MDNQASQSTSAPPKSSWLKRSLLALVIIIGGLVAVISMRPSDFKVTRSATFNAPPDVVFAQVNDFHKWEAWSPWAKMDPEAKNSFDGAESGTGAKFSWAGNSNVGEGNMTITESRPNELIQLKLEFIKPFAGTCDTEFRFEPKGDQTEMTWTMSGKNNFMAKAIGLFMDCDKMIGDNFEQGMANIKKIVEGSQSEPTS